MLHGRSVTIRIVLRLTLLLTCASAAHVRVVLASARSRRQATICVHSSVQCTQSSLCTNATCCRRTHCAILQLEPRCLVLELRSKITSLIDECSAGVQQGLSWGYGRLGGRIGLYPDFDAVLKRVRNAVAGKEDIWVQEELSAQKKRLATGEAVVPLQRTHDRIMLPSVWSCAFKITLIDPGSLVSSVISILSASRVKITEGEACQEMSVSETRAARKGTRCDLAQCSVANGPSDSHLLAIVRVNKPCCDSVWVVHDGRSGFSN